MNLKIIQASDRIEVVNSQIIDKLYNLAYENETTGIESSISSTADDIVGSINAPAAYEDAVIFLRKKFPNLNITVQDNNYYIRFDSEEFKRICIEDKMWGDGIGMTKNQASSVTSLENTFKNNLNESLNFKDLQYFTSLNNNFNCIYYNNVNDLVSAGSASLGTWQNPNIIGGIDIIMPPNLQINYSSQMFGTTDGRIKLLINSVDWNGSFAYSSSSGVVFQNCKFITFDPSIIPNTHSFDHCVLFKACILDKCIFPEGVTKTKENFNSCSVSYIEFPTTITDVGPLFSGFRRDSKTLGVQDNSGCIVVKAVTPPSCVDSVSGYPVLPRCIYVPDHSVEAYKNAPGWSNASIVDKITAMSQMTEGELALGTVTQEDMDRV